MMMKEKKTQRAELRRRSPQRSEESPSLETPSRSGSPTRYRRRGSRTNERSTTTPKRSERQREEPPKRTARSRAGEAEREQMGEEEEHDQRDDLSRASSRSRTPEPQDQEPQHREEKALPPMPVGKTKAGVVLNVLHQGTIGFIKPIHSTQSYENIFFRMPRDTYFVQQDLVTFDVVEAKTKNKSGAMHKIKAINIRYATTPDEKQEMRRSRFEEGVPKTTRVKKE